MTCSSARGESQVHPSLPADISCSSAIETSPLLKRLPTFFAGGHGIGKTFHANPYVLHHKNDVNNGIMALGHTFTIEPLICEGTGERDKVTRGYCHA